MTVTVGTPLTDAQSQAIADARIQLSQLKCPFGKALSLEERTSLPAPGTLPSDLSVHVEIAPPLSVPLSSDLLGGCALKSAERVPLFFYSLQSQNAPESSPTPSDTKVIFHIHGGGNVVGSPTHEPFVRYFGEMLRAVASQSGDPLKCVLVAPSYRLATVPENTYPAALQDLVAAYDYVLSKGYDPANIIVTGDSAGGNHAIVIPYLISKTNRPLPSGIIALAPLSIQAFDSMTEYAKAQADSDILSLQSTDDASGIYIGDCGVPRIHPAISGAYISFPESWPKTLILVGSSDQLIDASRELEKRISETKRPVELIEYDRRPHGWWTFSDIFPEEIRDSTQRIAQFLLS